jgi:hypothetical protein
MMSSVTLSGRLGEILAPNARFVEVDRLVFTPLGGRYETDRFVVVSPGENTLLLSSPEGALIYLKGRIETAENFGFVIIDELDEIFTLPQGMKERKSCESSPRGLSPLEEGVYKC